MNKYRDKSDFEINEAVTEELIQSGFIIGVEYHDKHILVTDKYANNYPFDPCNNPYDAMPIIIENKISIIHKKNDGTWYAYQPFKSVEHENFYRAAMELFLLMKDAENEKS